jgi:S-adenosylmethionine:tRNA ribosyltransferase-isomerase
MALIPPEFNLDSYDYPLPEELIAYYPPSKREESKLLVIDRKNQAFYFHEKFSEIEKYFRPGDVLVLNKTKVFPARIKAKKSTGGTVEVLLLNKPHGSIFQTEALIKGKRIKPGTHFVSEGGMINFRVLDQREDGKYYVEIRSEVGLDLEELIKKEGKAPLPPYIKREPEDFDLLRYQTVYAEEEGSVAAPTAGFHFTEELLNRLSQLGVKIKFITLHVGYGTFKPIKTKDIRKHRLDPEYIKVPSDVVDEVRLALSEGRRIIACGTTTVRALEFVAEKGLSAYEGLCDLYIYPSYRFKVVSAMITNFHLPKSSLLLLVCAFAGRNLVLKAYEEAIKRRYRFYSYGDATFII